MIADPEDVLMLLLSFAPVILLLVWLMQPKSKIRMGLVITSLVLFFLFLPFTSLYLGIFFTDLMPSLATSTAIGENALLILAVGPVFCLFLVGVFLFRMRRKKK